MAKEQPDYLAYLLRLWRTSRRGRVTWRASVESAETRERRGFANLNALFDFLRQETSVMSDSEGSGPGDDELSAKGGDAIEPCGPA